MAQRKIFITRSIREEVRRHLERFGTVLVWDEQRPIPQRELLSAVKSIDALVAMPDDHITREVIEAAEQLRVISIISAHYDHVDIAAASERGIVVTHTPGTADDAVADLAMTLLLALGRHIIDAHVFVREGKWQYWYPELFIGSDIEGSAIGIIGLGSVGLRLAHRALGFAMRVLYYDPQRNEDAEQLLGIQYGSLDNVLREADFVILLLPSVPSTHSLIDARRLHLMKPNAYIINMSGGPIIEHDALVQALREGWIAGAGLDVFDEEPLTPDEALLDLPNVIFSPHIGSGTHHALSRMLWMAAGQLLQVLRGETPAHSVPRPQENDEAA